MRRVLERLSVVVFLMLGMVSFSTLSQAIADEKEEYQLLQEIIVLEFSNEVPHEWGETVSGVATHLKTEDKVIALTFNACGTEGSGYDEGLIEYLQHENIPATLFLSGKWISQNPSRFKELSSKILFDLANHGLDHKPVSVRGKTVKGFPTTKNVEEVFQEIEDNSRKMSPVIGHIPRYYRPGMGYLDDISVRIAKALGYEVVGATLGNDGGELGAKKIQEELLNVPIGAIIAFPMDRPGQGSLDALKNAVPKLRAKGFKFVKLSEYLLE